MASIDWTKIRMEYITSDCAYRDLAKKYGIALSGIARKAKLEDWQKAKERHRNKVGTEVEQKIIDKKATTFAEYAVEQQSDLIELNRMLIEKARQTLGLYEEALSPRDLKSISGMLTDLILNNEKMKAEQSAGSSEKITVEFVNNIWDEEGGDANS